MIASLTGLLKTLLILFGIYLLLRILLRFFGPRMMQYFIRKITKKAEQRFKNMQSDFNSENKTGKTTIDFTPPNQPASDKDSGEYIDYEEID